jgi:hypothetical protein
MRSILTLLSTRVALIGECRDQRSRSSSMFMIRVFKVVVSFMLLSELLKSTTRLSSKPHLDYPLRLSVFSRVLTAFILRSFLRCQLVTFTSSS